MKIDLNQFRSSRAQIFAGRDRGSSVRTSIGDLVLDEANEIELEIPEDVYTINSSFFLGLFGKTIRKHGKEKFKNILKVNTLDFEQPLNDAIREALETEVLL